MTGAVVVHRPDEDVAVRARHKGVVLAAGGFPHDVARRAELFPRTPTGREHWSLAPAEPTGDGSPSVSPRVDCSTPLASPAAWCPVSLVPYRSARVGSRTSWTGPNRAQIAVLSTGHRFVNEANGYYEFARDDRRRPRGRAGPGVVGGRPRLPAPFPFGMAKPLPVAALAVPSIGLSD